ncbi:MAG: hypothetical protein IT580_23965 [Verrucomicrobiales bacterium]|nr:hypothetical protein [Verrucomicrobiales bacterium]
MDPIPLILCPNELPVGQDGWMMLAPWGRFPQTAHTPDGREQRYIQVVDPEAARELLANAKSFTGRALRFFRALPIFLGHPDRPGGKARYPDATPKGTIADIEIRPESGIWVRPALADSGADLVNGDQRLGLSPFWSARPVGTEGDAIVVRPTRLISAGLTPRPNLPVDMVNDENAKNQNHENTDMDLLKRIIAALAAAGATIANDATEDTAIAAIGTLGTDRTKAQQLANERATATTELTTAKARITTVEADLAARTTELANERKERVKLHLDSAIETGRITAAERPVWERRLTADLANEAPALAALTPKIPTQGNPAVDGNRKGHDPAQSPSAQLHLVVNESMRKDGMTYDEAWAKSKSTHAALHEALAKPA